MMRRPDKKKGNWKKRIFQEMVEYWINVCYLTLVFGAFTQYRRFLLAAYDITYTDYWVVVIEALILAKVILIGGWIWKAIACLEWDETMKHYILWSTREIR